MLAECLAVQEPTLTDRTVRRERALRAARRRLRLLEIESHRIKAELARLEADNEDDLADELSRGRRRGQARPPMAKGAALSKTDARVEDCLHAIAARPSPRSASHESHLASSATITPVRARSKSNGNVRIVSGRGGRTTIRGRARRRATPAWLWSFGLHVAALVLLVPWSFAVLTSEDLPLLASPYDLEHIEVLEPQEFQLELEEFEVVEIEPVSIDEPLELTESLADDLAPAMIAATDVADNRLGQLDALPSDLGTLMTGVGGTKNAGAPGGESGTAEFFGTKSQGNRFVFVVDNSSSMKNGRLEYAIDQLLSSVEALGRRQSFYVIFVSDQPYPMFYPVAAPALVPATKPNKERLRAWLKNVVLASGRNREIVKAMEMAAALRPDALFFLWDGHLPNERVRNDVMRYLTQPNQWRFPIHTFGMGVTSLDAKHHLSAIALAHGGTYRAVPVPQRGDRSAR